MAFSAKAMFEELKKGPMPVLTGMVDLDDKRPKVVMFAHGTDCSRWIPIPESMIVRFEHLGTVSCQDHSHPFVNLYLSRPSSAEEEAFLRANVRQPGPPVERGVAMAAMHPASGPHVPLGQPMGFGPPPCVFDLQWGWIIRGSNPPIRCPFV